MSSTWARLDLARFNHLDVNELVPGCLPGRFPQVSAPVNSRNARPALAMDAEYCHGPGHCGTPRSQRQGFHSSYRSPSAHAGLILAIVPQTIRKLTP